MRLIVENAVKEGTKKAITYGAAIVGGGIARFINFVISSVTFWRVLLHPKIYCEFK